MISAIEKNSTSSLDFIAQHLGIRVPKDLFARQNSRKFKYREKSTVHLNVSRF